MASNLNAMASNLEAMVSNLVGMATNLEAMASEVFTTSPYSTEPVVPCAVTAASTVPQASISRDLGCGNLYISFMPLGTKSYWGLLASLLGARTLLGAPGIATSNKKLIETRSLVLSADDPLEVWEAPSVRKFSCRPMCPEGAGSAFVSTCWISASPSQPSLPWKL